MEEREEKVISKYLRPIMISLLDLCSTHAKEMFQRMYGNANDIPIHKIPTAIAQIEETLRKRETLT